MKLSAEQQHRLSRLISAELDGAQMMTEILQHEHHALKSRDPERVLAISREKQQVVEQMQDATRQREHLLVSLGVPAGTAGTNALLEAGTETTCARLWSELQRIAVRLSEQNEINGGILALNQRHNKQALDLLCGRTGSRNTYGAKGQHNQDQPGHSLAKA